jgi:hypothetical protein
VSPRRTPAVELAHDFATLVPKFPLGNLPSHTTQFGTGATGAESQPKDPPEAVGGPSSATMAA